MWVLVLLFFRQLWFSYSMWFCCSQLVRLVFRLVWLWFGWCLCRYFYVVSRVFLLLVLMLLFFSVNGMLCIGVLLNMLVWLSMFISWLFRVVLNLLFQLVKWKFSSWKLLLVWCKVIGLELCSQVLLQVVVVKWILFMLMWLECSCILVQVFILLLVMQISIGWKWVMVVIRVMQVFFIWFRWLVQLVLVVGQVIRMLFWVFYLVGK